MQSEHGLRRPLDPAADTGHHRVIAEQVRHQRESNPAHQHLFEHLVLKQERMEHITEWPARAIPVSRVPVLGFGALKVGVRVARLEIRPHAVAPLRDIETLLEQPLYESVRARDLGRNDRVAVGVELRHVLLQAKLANLVPGALKTKIVIEGCFCHGAFLPFSGLHSKPGRETVLRRRRSCCLA